MCGIVGYIGKKQAAPILLDGLSKLEYRGYDSAGMAIFDGKKINMAKATGRLKVLSELTHEGATLPGTVGIGHTRWATHGAPSDINAHPHFNEAGTIAVVHNGIIENYMKLKKKLSEKGYKFQSDTDTEVVAQLLDYYYTGNPLETITKVMHRVEGSYALGIIFAENPDVIYAVRKDSPLIVGRGEGENLIASDIPAILKYTRDVYFIENEEIARLSEEKIEFFNVDGESIEKECKHIEWDIHAAEKGGYEHFMLKEMNEQLKDYSEMTEKMAETRERNRIAREIHDTLGHTMTGLSAGIDACIAMIDFSVDATKEQLNKISQVARQGIKDIRRSVNKLRPDALEHSGLQEALEKMINETMQVSDVKINYDCQVEVLKFNQDEEDMIYRVVQESITNAIRHGKAKQIDVNLWKEDKWLNLEIKDNGIGCEEIHTGFGLIHIEERIKMLKGTVEYDGSNGFKVTARIPIRWGEKL